VAAYNAYGQFLGAPGPALRAKDARQFAYDMSTAYMPDMPEEALENGWYGADDEDFYGEEAAAAAAAAPTRTKLKPFQAISRVFAKPAPGEATQIEKVQRTLSQAQQVAQQARQALVAPPAVAPAPPQIVYKEVQRYTGTEMAITAGIAVATFGLGMWLGSRMK
jgi:uncharacterized membrane protein